MISYRPSDTRYDAMLYNRCGRSGLKLPAISLGLWHNFGGVDTLENAPRDGAAARSTWASRTSTWPTTTARRPARPRRPSAGSCAQRPGGPPRRADHLHQGRLPHVARPVRRVGLAQVPARQPGPEPAPHGAGLRGHLLQPPPGPGHAAGGDHGRAGPGRAQGKALYAGISNYQPAADPPGRRRSCAAWARPA